LAAPLVEAAAEDELLDPLLHAASNSAAAAAVAAKATEERFDMLSLFLSD